MSRGKERGLSRGKGREEAYTNKPFFGGLPLAISSILEPRVNLCGALTDAPRACIGLPLHVSAARTHTKYPSLSK